jgi:hypothetical protein
VVNGDRCDDVGRGIQSMMVYRKFLRVVLCAVLGAFQTAPASAWMPHGSGAALPAGQLLLSLGGSDLPYAFINFAKSCTGPHFSGGAGPANITANGYPINGTLASGQNFYNACVLPTLAEYSGTWEFSFSGTGSVQLQFATISNVTDPQGCWNSSAANPFFVGTNCDVTFNITALSGGTNTNINFVGPATYSNISNIALIRSTDKTLFTQGQIWTPESVQIMKKVNPLALRTMGMTFPSQTGGNENSGSWSYRTPAAAVSYANPTWFPNLWSSSITYNGTVGAGYDQYTASGATDTPISWTDREMLQGTFPSASAAALSATAAADNGSGVVRLTLAATSTLTTNQQILLQNVNGLNNPSTVWTITVVDSTHIDLQGSTYSTSWNPTSGSPATIVTTTINIASRGAKFIVGSGYLGAPSIAASQNGTLVYDATFAVSGTSPTTATGALIYTSGAVNAGVPIEAQVQLANLIGKPLWFNIPPYYQTGSVTSLASYVCGNANSAPYVEYDNETWNSQWQTQWFTQHGLALGFILGSNRASLGAVGLYHRQLMAAATSACTSVKRVIGSQSATGVTTNFDLYEAKGSLLCGTSCGNALYQAFVGTDYNASPNRPIDYADMIAIDTYFAGTQEVGNGTLAQITGTCNGTTCTGIIAAATCYATPNSTNCGTGGSQQTALQFIDTDTRNGTFADGTTNNGSIVQKQTNILATWNTEAASLSKPLIAYEGGLGSRGQTASYLTGIGDANASTDATNINNLIIAYRASSLYLATYQYWNQQWFSNNSQVIGNSNLQLEGGGTINPGGQFWGLMQGYYLDNTFWQSYYGACAINGVSC